MFAQEDSAVTLLFYGEVVLYNIHTKSKQDFRIRTM
jgi:hypothetical protein